MTRKRHIEPPAPAVEPAPAEHRSPTFTVPQLARRWQCSPHTIRAAIVNGKLHAFRAGERQWRIPEAEVLRYERAGEAVAS